LKDLLEFVKAYPELVRYLPDKWSKKDRKWLIMIITTIVPVEFEKLTSIKIRENFQLK
jgi:hypothetical protein